MSQREKGAMSQREIVLNLTNESTHLRVQAERWSTITIRQYQKSWLTSIAIPPNGIQKGLATISMGTSRACDLVISKI